MTVLAGTIWGQLKTSHLYAVFKGQYVYFGETGHVPPVRWKGHLTSDKDFIGKLKDADPKVASDTTPIFFVGIHIGVADEEPETMKKIARRAIEAELHKRFSLDPTPITPASELLSSSPPVPAKHKFCFDKTLVAEKVYSMISNEYQKWRKEMEERASI